MTTRLRLCIIIVFAAACGGLPKDGDTFGDGFVLVKTIPPPPLDDTNFVDSGITFNILTIQPPPFEFPVQLAVLSENVETNAILGGKWMIQTNHVIGFYRPSTTNGWNSEPFALWTNYLKAVVVPFLP